MESLVNITIYDLNGREVEILTDDKMKAGFYSIIWNAESNSSGLYFITMIANDYRQTQKLILMK